MKSKFQSHPNIFIIFYYIFISIAVVIDIFFIMVIVIIIVLLMLNFLFFFNPSSANPTKRSNTPKQFVGKSFIVSSSILTNKLLLFVVTHTALQSHTVLKMLDHTTDMMNVIGQTIGMPILSPFTIPMIRIIKIGEIQWIIKPKKQY